DRTPWYGCQRVGSAAGIMNGTRHAERDFMRTHGRGRARVWGALAAAALAVLPLASARAQDSDAYLGTRTKVGYIDGAIPLNQIRFRFDAAYDDNRPDRGEFCYSQYHEQQFTPLDAAPTTTGCGGRGPGGGGGGGGG